MDKSIFEKYIQEMRTLKTMASPSAGTAAPTPKKVDSAPNSENMSGMGNLIVNVTSVRGLYPVSGAQVVVFTGDGENQKILARLITDSSGKTPITELPAPSSRFTETPEPSERPYSYYNIKTVADGFVDAYNYNVTVFDKVTSLQTVNLQPLTTGVDSNRPIVIDEFENYTL